MIWNIGGRDKLSMTKEKNWWQTDYPFQLSFYDDPFPFLFAVSLQGLPLHFSLHRPVPTPPPPPFLSSNTNREMFNSEDMMLIWYRHPIGKRALAFQHDCSTNCDYTSWIPMSQNEDEKKVQKSDTYREDGKVGRKTPAACQFKYIKTQHGRFLTVSTHACLTRPRCSIREPYATLHYYHLPGSVYPMYVFNNSSWQSNMTGYYRSHPRRAMHCTMLWCTRISSF